MAERRWGRVTVEGWIEQTPGRVKVWSGTDSRVGPLASTFGEGGPVSVEFLPEPVTFKDGDVYRFHGSCAAWSRFGDLWYSTAGGKGMPDSWMQRLIRRGEVERLVPGGNDG